MLIRVIEILTAPMLIAQFSVLLISLLWSFLILEAPSLTVLEAFLSGNLELKSLTAR